MLACGLALSALCGRIAIAHLVGEAAATVV